MIMNNTSAFYSFALVVLFSCQNNTRQPDQKTGEKDAAATSIVTGSVRPVHWGYSGENGPDTWANLTPVYASCGNGHSQSPIDISSAGTNATPQWAMEYNSTALQIAHHEHVEELINNGHTIQVTPKEGSRITYSGKQYNLKQFHFHTPSEHTIGGKHMPMEIHLVHQSDDKSLAVVGILVEEGAHNNNFDQLIKYLPNSPGEKKNHDTVEIDIAVHVPKQLDAYHYTGSLTTPPCTEDVQWLVLKKFGHLDKTQLEAFSSRLKNNNRPTQQLYERKIMIDEIASQSE